MPARPASREGSPPAPGSASSWRSPSSRRAGPGESSPLIIAGWITLAGGKREGFSVNVHIDESRVFGLADGRVFELVEHAYGEWMELRYYGELAAL